MTTHIRIDDGTRELLRELQETTKPYRWSRRTADRVVSDALQVLALVHNGGGSYFSECMGLVTITVTEPPTPEERSDLRRGL